MNILVLMAGGSEAFNEAGYLYPKNLVEIDGLPLVQRVIEPIVALHDRGHRIVCLVLRDENAQFHTADVIRLLMEDAVVVEVPMPTAGAACTALLAVDMIDTEEPLLIVNGDQVVDCDLPAVVNDFVDRRLDGGVLVFEAVHPRWSYVRCDAAGHVVEAAEKRPISRQATAGVYYFARGTDFVGAAMRMIRKDAHVGGTFYVCPVYNELVLKHARIGVYQIPREAYVSLATPQGVEAYEQTLRARSTEHALR